VLTLDSRLVDNRRVLSPANRSLSNLNPKPLCSGDLFRMLVYCACV
jgi:hypothetical protein